MIDWLLTVFLLVLLTIFILVWFNVITISFVNGSSMNPNFIDGQIFVHSQYYENLDYNDIVTIEKNGQNMIKRIVGKKDDDIIINNEDVFVNGIKSKVQRNSSNNDRHRNIMVEDDYFILGDNLQDSYDSRYFGSISEDDIIGKVIFTPNIIIDTEKIEYIKDSINEKT